VDRGSAIRNLMIILGIDTSCDDTSVAVYNPDTNSVLSEGVSSRIDLHAKYGGVVPEIAARQHLEMLLPMIDHALSDAGIKPDLNPPDLIAVTRGPGLIGGLLVGFSCAKALSMGWGVPYVGVNHINGHLLSVSLTHKDIKYPHIALVVSGGHSEIYLAKSTTEYTLLGETRDDAAGELLDKVGRLLDIPFPAGKIIDDWAMDSDKYGRIQKFPRPLIHDDVLEFSFSGLKTACLYFLKSEEAKKTSREAVGAEVLRSAVECLLTKAILACQRSNICTLAISGGVSSSRYLRKEADRRGRDAKIEIIFPDPDYSTDNAAMIALAGWHRYRTLGPDPYDLDCEASLPVV
jgi:N6-L-threonylcarbamoyladenine synthase